MSFANDCPACVMGRHGQHDANWGTTPGLIGGTHCDCGGDCEARFAASVRALRETLEAGK